MRFPNLTRNACSYEEECWEPMIYDANKAILHQSMHIVIFMMILILTGIPGNLLVIVVYTRQKKRTTALLFILCLAYVDMITLCIVHPYVIFKIFNSSNQEWDTLCKIFEFGIHASLCVSVAILFMVSIDRFVAICLPLKYFRYQTYAKYIMIGCCITGVTLSTPILLFYGKRPVLLEINDQRLYGYVCDYTERYQNSTGANVFGSIMFIFFVFTSVCLVIFYTCVARKAYMSRKVRPTNYILEVAPQTTTTQIFCTTSVVDNWGIHSKRRNCTTKAVDGGKIRSKILNCTNKAVDGGEIRSKRLNFTTHAVDNRSNAKRIFTTHLQTENRKSENRLARARKVLPDKLKAAKILSLVTLVFILSWLPFWIIKLYSMHTKYDTTQSHYENEVTNFFSHLFYLNNAVNPLIYVILHKTFRKECMKMFKR